MPISKEYLKLGKNIETAIAIFEGMDEQSLTSQAYTIRGKVHHLLGENALAEKDYKRSIALFSDTVKRNKQLGYNLESYATFLEDVGEHKKAYSMFDKSLFHLDADVSSDGELKQLNDFANVDHLIEALPGRGATLLSLYQQSNDSKYLEKALYNYTFLTSLYEKVIKESKSERSKLLQVPNLAAYYEKAVECALQLADITGNNQYKEKAFAFAEQSKAVVLWQYVHDSRSRKFAGIPDDIIGHERRLKEKLSFMESGMDTTAEWKNKYVALRGSYDSMILALEKSYPAYYNLKYNKPESDVNALAANLKPNEAIVEYLVGDSTVFGFVVSSTTFEVFEFKNDSINELSKNIKTTLAGFDQADFTSNSNAFYHQYFSSIDSSLLKKNINVITLITDGPISYIPFEAISRDNKYLINDYTFHYQYSAGLIPTYAAIARENSDSDFIGFAPTFGPSGSSESLAQLDFTSEEVGDITGMLHGKSLVGDEATETNFKKMVKDYGIVHVATHAVMDDHDASRSRLHFSPKDSLEDGKLHAWELFNLQIRASLVTLSACNTGAGQVHKGEGVMSLSRAFAYAGCPEHCYKLVAGTRSVDSYTDAQVLRVPLKRYDEIGSVTISQARLLKQR
ncbi:MAG: CHAT domain-containing protein [Bacteroidota bacterium]